MASLARCVIAVEAGAPCSVPRCRTNVSQIDISWEAELIWSLHSSDRQIATLLSQQQTEAERGRTGSPGAPGLNMSPNSF